MRRVPLLATIIVALAIATMIGLGVWQLGRAEWKEALLASYRAAAGAPPLAALPAGASADKVAFRHVRLGCRTTGSPILLGGSDRAGNRGFRTIVGCVLADGRTIMADLGVSPLGANPEERRSGLTVDGEGVLIPDEVLARRVLGDARAALPVLLVLDRPAPGLGASAPPAIETIPNNHRSYAVQWFLFALVALVIYLLALWKRSRAG